VSPRILLVDDEATLRKTLERALSNFGYEVSTAPDAHSAYALLGETPVDLVLLDLRMPHMAGDALYLAIVRRWPEMQGRVVLMSGDPWSHQDTWPAELRACPMLPKPFTLDILARTVATVLARAEAADQLLHKRQGNGQ
jgi:DNA-binding response OmpR family regulator